MANLQYLGGIHDPLVEQIGRAIATELAAETRREIFWSKRLVVVSPLACCSVTCAQIKPRGRNKRGREVSTGVGFAEFWTTSDPT
jgi:hypothetical protein